MNQILSELIFNKYGCENAEVCELDVYISSSSLFHLFPFCLKTNSTNSDANRELEGRREGGGEGIVSISLLLC